jgi:hypothetical protein
MTNLLQRLMSKGKEREVHFNFLIAEASPELALDRIKIKLFGILPRYYDQIRVQFISDTSERLERIVVSCSSPTSRFKQEGEWKIFYDLYNIYVPISLRTLGELGIKAVCAVEHVRPE